jgi:hypothetical protein
VIFSSEKRFLIAQRNSKVCCCEIIVNHCGQLISLLASALRKPRQWAKFKTRQYKWDWKSIPEIPSRPLALEKSFFQFQLGTSWSSAAHLSITAFKEFTFPAPKFWHHKSLSFAPFRFEKERNYGFDYQEKMNFYGNEIDVVKKKSAHRMILKPIFAFDLFSFSLTHSLVSLLAWFWYLSYDLFSSDGN